MISITQFGAVGDGAHLNTEAIQSAVSAAKAAGEVLNIPAGTFLTGTIDLMGVSLHLSAGAVLKGSERMEDYPIQPYRHNEMGPLRALIMNIGHDHVSICGKGCIDLSGQAFYDHSRYNIPPTRVPITPQQERECTWFISERPNQCLFFSDCTDIEISGITLIDAPCWTISLNRCRRVRLTGLTIDTDLNTPNNDGIHLCSCEDAIISDCHISSGDDCIALSCITGWETPCRDIVIANCVLRSCSKAIVIGYVYSEVRNVLISNCIIRESNRGLCVMCHTESALVENVRVSNMLIDTRVRAGNWWGNGEPILLMAVPHATGSTIGQEPKRKTDCAIRNFHVSGVTCTGENAMGIIGTNSNIQNVSLTDIDYTRKPSANLPLKGAAFDLSPSEQRVTVPEDCALYVAGAQDVRTERMTTHGCQIIFAE
ncbi:MAG: right-handed parallel beta-helix repeat-containing protein [Clostridia bacterium]|nr:right-handed parallel beta-helix repeat-containing protein [Clostridia bacterium]